MKQTYHILSKILHRFFCSHFFPVIFFTLIYYILFLFHENTLSKNILSKIMLLNRFPSNIILKEKWIQVLISLNNKKKARNYAKLTKYMLYIYVRACVCACDLGNSKSAKICVKISKRMIEARYFCKLAIRML